MIAAEVSSFGQEMDIYVNMEWEYWTLAIFLGHPHTELK